MGTGPEFSTKRSVLWRHWRPWPLTGFLLLVALGGFWLFYGLWMENRASAWEVRNPSQPGPMDQKAFPTVYNLLLPCGLVGLEILSGFFERGKRRRILTGKRINRLWIFAFGTVGLSVVLLAIYLGMKTIDFYLWSNQPAVELQRKAEIEEWQKLSKMHPDFHWDRPMKALNPTRLAMLLLGALVLCWSGVSFVRKVASEFLFVRFRSAEEEEREKAMALMGSQAEDKKSFRVEQASPRTVRRVSILLALAGAAVIGLFGLSPWLAADDSMALILPTATTFAAVLTIAIGLLAVWRNRNLLGVCLLAAAASVAGLWYLGSHYEFALSVVGAALGIFLGIVLVVQLRNSVSSTSVDR